MIGVHSDAITDARDLDPYNRYQAWVGYDSSGADEGLNSQRCNASLAENTF